MVRGLDRLIATGRVLRGVWRAQSARRRRLAAFALLAFTALGIFHRVLFFNNFGIVDPGLVYRSGQPTKSFTQTIETYRLKSVLNLRGGSEADPWYASEVRTACRNGVAFYDMPMPATRRPRRRELLALLDLLQRCPYPLLIHCKWGADRTGFASGLYLMLVREKPPREALKAFSLHHGHVPVGGPQHLHEPFYEYEVWLQSQRLSHTPARLRRWAMHVYRDKPVLADRSSLNRPPSAFAAQTCGTGPRQARR